MKFDVISDIHLDFFSRCPDLKESETERWIANPENHPVLIVAGDIDCGLSESKSAEEFFKKAASHYEKVIIVLGNHDYWGYIYETEVPGRVVPLRTFKGCSFKESTAKAREKFAQYNVTVLDATHPYIQLGDNTFVVGSTLWTDITPDKTWYVNRSMNDYRMIMSDIETSDRITVQDTIEANKVEFKAIEDFVEQHKDSNIIVVTHHCPSEQSNVKYYRDDPLTAAYCNRYDNWIAEHPNIKCWVHGHVHSEHDYNIGGTRIISNPCGYIKYERDLGTYSAKTIEI